MRRIYHNFITEEEVEQLKLLKVNKSNQILLNPNSVIDKIIDTLKKDFEFEIKKESYYRLEQTADHGHGWHKDTGSNDHMLWCQVGCSILLESECSGGATYYKESGKIIEVDRDKLDLIAHTSNIVHKVDPPKGYRLVFLIFI